MKYQVLENSKPCSWYKIKGWNVDTFNTKEEAELFAALWAYPISKEEAKNFVKNMELGVPVDMSMSEYPVMMEIREIKGE